MPMMVQAGVTLRNDTPAGMTAETDAWSSFITYMNPAGAHRPHGGQIIPMADLANGNGNIEAQVAYFSGGGPGIPGEAHDRYAADDPGSGRDKFINNAFKRAKFSAELQTFAFVQWSKWNMDACVRRGIFRP